MIIRTLNINLPSGKSAFLWGARKTGKSTYLRMQFSESIYINLLDTDLHFELLKRPALLREHILSFPTEKAKLPIIVNEVQKIPLLLEEIHLLIEEKGLSFILCGSSARKLKRGKANLLGGRAWRFEMFPLTSFEIKDFNLLKGLNSGLIPDHYLEREASRSLRSYIQDYLKEEIMAEGLVRNIPAFFRFLDSVGYCHNEIIIFSNIARDAGVDSKTVREYFQILADTLLGVFIEPFDLRPSRDIISRASKFYLFDVGLAGSIQKRTILEEKGSQFGQAFEHFILMELLAHRSYRELFYEINFWRTKAGYEADFILDKGRIALEIKGTSSAGKMELRSLNQFIGDYNPQKAILVCNEKYPRQAGNILILPWRIFLQKLWQGEII